MAKHDNADGLLWLPLNVAIEQYYESEDADVICTMEEQQLDCLPIQACDNNKATMVDTALSQVYSYTLSVVVPNKLYSDIAQWVSNAHYTMGIWICPK